MLNLKDLEKALEASETKLATLEAKYANLEEEHAYELETKEEELQDLRDEFEEMRDNYEIMEEEIGEFEERMECAELWKDRLTVYIENVYEDLTEKKYQVAEDRIGEAIDRLKYDD